MDKKKPYCNINNPAKILGRKITKSRQGNSKIFKNLSRTYDIKAKFRFRLIFNWKAKRISLLAL